MKGAMYENATALWVASILILAAAFLVASPASAQRVTGRRARRPDGPDSTAREPGARSKGAAGEEQSC